MKQHIKELTASIKHNRPALIIGKAGTAKTATVRKIASELGYPIETMLLAGILPEDLGGLVRPDNIDAPTCFTYLPPQWALKYGNDPFVLFLDEVNQASIQTLHALFYLVNDRAVAGVTLPNMRIVAAGNGVDENEFLTPLPAPLLDRFVYRIAWENDAAVSFDYLRQSYSHLGKTVDRLFEAITKSNLSDVTPRHVEQMLMLLSDGTDTLQRGRELIGSAYDAFIEDKASEAHAQNDRMQYLSNLAQMIKIGKMVMGGKVVRIDAEDLLNTRDLTEEERDMVRYYAAQ